MNEINITEKEALDFHSSPVGGTLEVSLKKKIVTQKDYSLAYTPGVAFPCKEIIKNPEAAYKYTSKGNLVGMISNGTAVLGLGNIGALASKPVIENKAALLKKFAGIDSFDIEINEPDPYKFIEIVEAISPTFGAINLEDIKAPDCFIIEQELQKRLNIPVMHDDQHGTAIVSSAALLNALEIVNKKISEIKIVINGAGAAAIACANLYLSLGASLEKITMCDSKGVITQNRSDLNDFKKKFATKKNIKTLKEALVGADFFLGLSVANILSAEDIKKMGKNPIIFALANPDPEIPYNIALKSRPDAIIATGRSDFPNQINNILGYPYIFKGALEARAPHITKNMQIAAVKAIAGVAKIEIEKNVMNAYNLPLNIKFGPLYILPKMIDSRLLKSVSSAVKSAAISL